MSFVTFLEEKIVYILFQLFFLVMVVFLLFSSGVDGLYIFLMLFICIIFQTGFLWLTYRSKRRKNREIIEMTDKLQETYYISEILPKPREVENEAYYYALKRACKAMNDKISMLEAEQLEYQEYVESFAHEIKIPIGALSLTFDNTRNYLLKKETDKIFQLVEQMLYYARSENTEKDYFVKRLSLDEIVHQVLLKFRYVLLEEKVILDIHDTENVIYTDEKWLSFIVLLEEKVILDIHDTENVIYTDEKWLSFILSQILQNAVKYMDKPQKKLTVYSADNRENIALIIEDNGCGIRRSELASGPNWPEYLKKDLPVQTERKQMQQEWGYIWRKNCATGWDYSYRLHRKKKSTRG